jgi:sugar O-acyltransferase (sialic acid O-acetyltransferase NeuD family)
MNEPEAVPANASACMTERPRAVIAGIEWDVVELLESCGYEVAGFLDPAGAGDAGRDIPVLGADDAWPELSQADPALRVALAIDVPEIRARLLDYYGEQSALTAMSPRAYVSSRAVVGAGCLIQHGVTIMPYARIGRACKLNVNACVHHEAVVADFCTLAPGSLVLGRVIIEEACYVGAGAIIRQRCRLGRGALVGAGAVVVEDVPPGAVVVGVPAERRLR